MKVMSIKVSMEKHMFFSMHQYQINQPTNNITYKELLGELTQYIDCNYYATVLQVQYHEVPQRIHHLA